MEGNYSLPKGRAGGGSCNILLFIAVVEEIDGFEFLAQLHFLLGSDVLEGSAVGAEVEADELHDALAADDVAAEVADDVDDILGVVLQGASLLEVAFFPSTEDACQAAPVVVRGAADASLSATHSQTGQDGLVLAVEHIELAVLVAAAAVVFIEALEGVLDTSEVGDATIYGLQEVIHREEGAVEGRDVIKVEGEIRCSASNLFAVLDQLFDASDLREGRSHGADAKGANLLGVLSQLEGTAHTGAAYMDDDLEILECLSGIHPGFGQLHSLFLGEHIAFATGTIDEHTFKTVALEQCSIFGDDREIDAAVGIHRGERSVDETFDFFHINDC